MVVKKASKRKGRPPGDPDDVRTERVAIRMHTDLVFEIQVLARLEGITRSQMIERMMIRTVNDHYARTVVDKVGRYLDGPPEITTPKGVEFLRSERQPKVRLRRPVDGK
jgi:hypothetical protein